MGDEARHRGRGSWSGASDDRARTGSLRLALGAALLSWLLPSTLAQAAETGSTSSVDFTFLSEIILLILVGRVFGEAMQRLGQPAVMGALIGGLVLGPSALGALWPETQHALFPTDPAQRTALNAFAQFGVLLLLLLTGMETELRLLQRIRHAAVAVSVAGICLPFAVGFSLGEFLPAAILPHPDQRLVCSLFIGTALSISSVKIVAMVVREMNFTRRNVGSVILAASVIDDTVGWMILAITFSLAQSGAVDASRVAATALGTLLFLAGSITVGRRLVPRLIRWANDLLVTEGAVIALVLLLMGGMALVTHSIGVHTVLGAFVAGILVGESPMLTGNIDRQLRGIIAGLVTPVFFGLAGLNADLTILRDPTLLGLTGLLILIASIGKFAGAFLGGRLAGMTGRESLALACGMNARGSTEVIVATVGLSIGILSRQLFTMIVTMAVITTLAMPPMLRWALRRLPLSRDERARIEREQFEARSFLANMERVLLAVDESSNAAFAARLVGMLAGFRGLPATVLHIGAKSRRRAPETGPEAALETGARAAAAANAGPEGTGSQVDVTSRHRVNGGVTQTVTEEAEKGYGLLAIGVESVTTEDSEFHHSVAAASEGFTGPLIIVRARDRHLEHPLASDIHIILPVTGTEVSRRAAEVAVALARPAKTPIVALHVAATRNGGRRARGTRRRAHEEAMLQDVAALARRYGATLKMSVHVDAKPDQVILRAANGHHDLIVMGVNRRPGKPLYFGEVAASVIRYSKASVVLVAN